MAVRMEAPRGNGESEPGLNPSSNLARRRDLLREERLRYRVDSLKEIGEVSDEQAQRYLDFLHDDQNRKHFANPPSTVEELKAYAKKPSPDHPLIAFNGLNEVVGGLVIEDARWPQHDHFISLFVVDPGKQRKGIGIQMMRFAIDWASKTLTYDGRPRRKLDLAIIKDIEGWERMRALALRFGFEKRSTLPEQVDVEFTRPDGSGVIIQKPTQRYEIMLDKWRTIKGLRPPAPSPYSPRS